MVTETDIDRIAAAQGYPYRASGVAAVSVNIGEAGRYRTGRPVWHTRFLQEPRKHGGKTLLVGWDRFKNRWSIIYDDRNNGCTD